MTDPELLKDLLLSDDPTLNFCASPIGLNEIEIILEVLRIRGRIKIVNVSGVPPLMALGAWLHSFVREEK